jgi:hypothetical protein
LRVWQLHELPTDSGDQALFDQNVHLFTTRRPGEQNKALLTGIPHARGSAMAIDLFFGDRPDENGVAEC